MTASSNQPDLDQARRNQLFEDRPATGSAQCPLKALEVAIFPVRYAIDESAPKGSSQGPNPLPAGFEAGHLPVLESRSYTLRQIRDGWLYVWDETDTTFHEYIVQGHLFTRVIWHEADRGKDDRSTEGETLPYLLYPRRSTLHIAYSPVRWTWRLCERMRSSPRQQLKWMRELDLTGYCATYQAPHGAELRRLAECVADISPEGVAPAFTTTLIPAEGESVDADDSAMQIKPGISDAQVLGAVPDQDTALFIALDDPLGVIDDLNMQLNGRLGDIALFEEEHRQQLQSAMAVHQACGVNLDDIMPAAIKDNVQQRLAFTADAQRFMSSHARVHDPAFGGIAEGAGSLHSHQANVDTMRNKWQVQSNHPAWDRLSEEWQAKDTWRHDVRFDEVCAFLHERADELKRLRTHVQASEADLIYWLDQLNPDADELFYDTCNVKQSTALLSWADGIAQSLGGCGSEEADTPAQDSGILYLARVEFQGQTWLYRQMAEQNSLIGLALFNFNRELAQALELIAFNYSSTGTIDGLGQQPDNSGQVNTGSGFWLNTLKGVGSVQDLLSLESVRSSKIYQSLSDVARLSFDALLEASAEQAQGAWSRLSALFLPALAGHQAAHNSATAARVLSFTLAQLWTTPEVARHASVQLNPDFTQEQQKWNLQQQALLNRQRGLQNALSRPSAWYDKKSANNQLTGLNAEWDAHTNNRPQHLRITVNGQPHFDGLNTQYLKELMSTAGQAEAIAQQQLKLSNPVAHAARAKAWIDLNLGGTLPLALAGLGLWNLMVTTHAVHYDGHLSSIEKNQLLTSLASSGSLLMALMVMPMWARVGNMTGVIDGETFKLTKAGAREWLKEGQLGHAKLAQRLIARTAGMAALSVIASVSEIVQINEQMKKATSSEQAGAMRVQQLSLVAMGVAGAFQLGGSLSGLQFSFAWVMGGWMVGFLAIAGLVYLVASIVVSLYYREGLRLWLYQCYWGKAATVADSEAAHKKSLWQLAQICLTPGVTVRATGNPYTPTLNGAWLHFSLPAQLAGQHCEIKAVFVRKTGGVMASRTPIALDARARERLAGGYWSQAIEAEPLLQMPPPSRNDQLPGDASYPAQASHYHWRTWISVSGASYVELEITYADVLDPDTQVPASYTFRASLPGAPRNAELISNPLSGEPIDGELLSRSSAPAQRITLPVPTTES
ncbi:MAG: T6SS effector BTH_I2691 family protein [Halopseudomonas sp.]|uniref:T6SS effector BTH_I2691 family protein n=1 Tax=Halopseudomonas sp. TaxID=2901191 RepID=UPI0030030D9E